MDFIKKHYEKIILVAVLLGVVGFLVFLPFVIAADKKEIDDKRTTFIPKPKALPALDMSSQDAVMARLQSPTNFDFSTRNKLFNPIMWKRNANNELIPIKSANDIGPGAVVVTKITPLYMVVALLQVDTNTSSPRYVIGLTNQAAATESLRHGQTRYAAVGDKKDLFTLKSVKGDPLNPESVELTLADTGEQVTVSKDKPFQRPEAYTADLKYPPENKTFPPGRRMGAQISFNGENYNIFAIDAGIVVLSSQANQKKTPLHYTP